MVHIHTKVRDRRQRTGQKVNVFPIEEVYLFKHYFEGDEVFDRLKPYYNNSQYRFEVPTGQFDTLRSFLSEQGYELEVVDAVEKYVVVVEQYTAHPENVFEESVLQRTTAGHNCFLMTDKYAVARAVPEGATRLADTDVTNPFR